MGAAGWRADWPIIGDIRNTAPPNEPPRFADRNGKFVVTAAGREIAVEGQFEAKIYRFDFATFNDSFDVDTLYMKYGEHLTGPWDVFLTGQFAVPTPEVLLDGRLVYRCWMDVPGIEDFAAKRITGSFGLKLAAGVHKVVLRFLEADKRIGPGTIGSIAVGEDERNAAPHISLKKELIGKHPRLQYTPEFLDMVRKRREKFPQLWERASQADPILKFFLGDPDAPDMAAKLAQDHRTRLQR